MPEVLLVFRGPVSLRSTPATPGLSLAGRTAQPADEEATLAFSAAAPADCPQTLEDAIVECLGDGHYRVSSGARAWLIGARAVHLHFEVAAQFYRAIPPRPVPWRKRLFWRTVLALAASRAGLAVLRALRR